MKMGAGGTGHRHDAEVIRDCPRAFEGLRDYLREYEIEGIVF